MRWVGSSLMLAVVVGGCQGRVDLLVDVRTDFVPGTQFSRVETTVLGEDRMAVLPAEAGDPFTTGVRVAELYDLSPSSARRISVTLVGSANVTRIVQLDNSETVGITVVISASCAGVVCPEGTSCLEGECVDLECVTGTEPACSNDGGVDGGAGDGSTSDGGTARDRPTMYALMLERGVPMPSASIEIVDLETFELVDNVPISRRSGSSLAVSPDGTTFYVSDYVAANVGFIDSSGTTRGTVPLAASPRDLVLDATGTRLFVASTGRIDEIDTRTQRVVRGLDLGGDGLLDAALSADGSALVASANMVGADSALYIFDTADFTGDHITLTGVGACTPAAHGVAVSIAGDVLVWDGRCDALYQFALATRVQNTARSIATGEDGLDGAHPNTQIVYSETSSRAYAIKESGTLVTMDLTMTTPEDETMISGATLALRRDVAPSVDAIYVTAQNSPLADTMAEVRTDGTTTDAVYTFSVANQSVRQAVIATVRR